MLVFVICRECVVKEMDLKSKFIGRFVLEVSIDYNNKNRQAKMMQIMLSSGKDKGRRRILRGMRQGKGMRGTDS